MKLTLKPISHPKLGKIDVTQTLFPIGREDAPFVDYDPESVASLSRRHGRIFEHEGAYFVVDLHSSNGTTLNGKDVTRSPEPIKDGDEICFGNQLRYKLLVDASTPSHRPQQEPVQQAPISPRAQQAATGPLQLRLVPELEVGIDTIIVTSFPFLINRDSEVFAKYQDRLGDEIRFLSRRHAHIFENGNALFIEDLGSRNGTFLNSNRLGDQAQPLKDGDSIALSGECFVYTVRLEQAGAMEFSANAGLADNSPATIIHQANSFMDIYADEEDDAEPSDIYINTFAKPANLRKSKSKKAGKFDLAKALHVDKAIDYFHRIKIKPKPQR